MKKMAVGHGDDVKENVRAACPYLLNRISYIENSNDRQEALNSLKPLLRKMDWEKYPVRFMKLFKAKYNDIVGD